MIDKARPCIGWIFHLDCQLPDGHDGPHETTAKGKREGRVINEVYHPHPDRLATFKITWEVQDENL